MSHGLQTSRDFQVGEEMAWHKKTKIKTPEVMDFPDLVEVPVYFGADEPREIVRVNGEPYVVAVSSTDSKPVAQPYNPKSYTLFTPKQAWQYVMGCLSGTGFKVESIGMLWNQSFWFISILLDELKTAMVAGDKTGFQLNFSGGLDKSVSPQAELSGIRAVCHNTISLSRMSGKVLFKKKATANFHEVLESRKQDIEKCVGMAAIFKATMDSLVQKPVTVDEARQAYAGFITPETENKAVSTRTKNTVETLTTLFQRGDGNKGETRYDVLNGFTQLYTRGNESKPKDDTQTFRLIQSSEYGDFADKKAEFASLVSDDERYQKTVARGQVLLKA